MNLKVYNTLRTSKGSWARSSRTVKEQECARNLGTIDLIALAELIEVPKNLIWETKSKVPMEAEL